MKMSLKIWFGCRKRKSNFRVRQKVKIARMDMEKPSEPDSTTLEKDVRQEFRRDEDVLFSNKKDDCFYLGTVVQVDANCRKCLVEFMDNTKKWCSFDDLKSFATQENESCYICKKSQSENNNKILVCKCGRACHQLCHQPHIPNSTTDWICKLCAPPTKYKEEKCVSKKLSPSKKVVTSNTSPTLLNKLPYNLESLTWDLKHQINKEGRYCYCGKNGLWNDNMLQCGRCRQWFHVKCSKSVGYPILKGDKFFEFTCSICNRGKEKYKRLAMKWPDLVSLIKLNFNLNLKEETKDYDIDNTILTFVKKHWDDFMLPPEVSKASLEDYLLKYLCKKDFVLSEAESKPLQNGDINSSEAGCRVIEPQKSEHKTVPRCVISFTKPYSTTLGDRDREVTGKLKTSHSTDFKVISSSEYSGRGLVKRSTPFPDQSNKRDKRFRSHAVRKASRLLNKTIKRKQKTDETSVLDSKVVIDQSSDEEDDEDEDEEDDDDDEEEEDEAEEEEDEDTSKYSESEDFLDDRKRKMSLRTRVSNPEVRKRPQRNLLEARLNSTESKLYNAFTPVDISKTKKNRNVVPEPKPTPKKSKPLKPKIEKINIKTPKPKLVQKTIFDSFNIKSTKGKVELIPVVRKYKIKDDQSSGDSKSNSNSVKSDKNRKRRHSIGSEIQMESDVCGESSDDEASSRGTLDPFIPSTKDFDGQNNPFRTVSDLINTAAGVTTFTVPPITLPLPLKTVIPHTDPPRLKKRQLSEEDIIIDRNGQVKRRRRQRKNRLIERALASGTASKTAQIVPGRNNCVDYALSKRQLRARESMKLTDSKPVPPTAKSTGTTPVKQSPAKDGNPVAAEDLESSVKYFFGPAGRIASGEKYEVVAKRVTPDGRLQCVVEWKGVRT